MRRRRFTIRISIVLFLAFTLVGTYVVRKRILERHMVSAMQMNDKETIRSLLDAWPCPVNAVGEENRTALFWAVDRHRTDIALVAIAKGADVNVRSTTGMTPLHWAANRGERELVRALLDAGADVNAVCRFAKTTPLVNSTTDEEVIRLLLAKGADAKASRGSLGWTALHHVAGSGTRRAAELLVAHGADVNARDEDGETPLFWAAAPNRPGIVSFLLDTGAAVNVKNAKGRTPLHRAVEHLQVDVAALLIQNGAKVDAADNDGRTPLAVARGFDPDGWIEEAATHTTWTAETQRRLLDYMRRRKKETIELLRKHGAAADAETRTPKPEARNEKK